MNAPNIFCNLTIFISLTSLRFTVVELKQTTVGIRIATVFLNA